MLASLLTLAEWTMMVGDASGESLHSYAECVHVAVPSGARGEGKAQQSETHPGSSVCNQLQSPNAVL